MFLVSTTSCPPVGLYTVCISQLLSPHATSDRRRGWWSSRSDGRQTLFLARNLERVAHRVGALPVILADCQLLPSPSNLHELCAQGGHSQCQALELAREREDSLLVVLDGLGDDWELGLTGLHVTHPGDSTCPARWRGTSPRA